MRYARSQIEVVTVLAVRLSRPAAHISSVPVGVWRSRVIAKDTGGIDTEGRLVESTERDAMLHIGVERTDARAAVRIVRVDGLIAHGAQVALVSGIGEAELVCAGEHIAGRVRVRVEALQLELCAQARVAANVDAGVLGKAAPVPDAEAAEGREPALPGGGIDGIPAEAERNVLVIDVRSVDVQSQPRIDLPRVT